MVPGSHKSTEERRSPIRSAENEGVKAPIAPNCPRIAHTKFPLVIKDPPKDFLCAWKQYLCDVVAAVSMGRIDFSESWKDAKAQTGERNRIHNPAAKKAGRKSGDSSIPARKRKRQEPTRRPDPQKRQKRSESNEGGSSGSAPGHGRATTSSGT